VDGHQLPQALDRDAEEVAADVIGMVVRGERPGDLIPSASAIRTSSATLQAGSTISTRVSPDLRSGRRSSPSARHRMRGGEVLSGEELAK
jgi:hypothetical protein